MNEFNLKVSNYQSTTNFLKSTAEVRGDIELSVFSSGSKIDYTKKLTTASGSTGNEESYEDYLSTNYEKVPVQLNAKLKMNVQLAMDRKFLYFTLSAPEKTVTGTDKEVEEFENMIDAVNEYSGKTYKIATENSMDLTFASGKSKIQAVLSVLEKESLLEAKKRGADDSYQLDIKKSTLQSMNVALGRKKNADISGLKSLGGTLVYKKSGGLTTLKLTPAYAKTKALKDKNFMLLENT
jgi:hypothetical protein